MLSLVGHGGIVAALGGVPAPDPQKPADLVSFVPQPPPPPPEPEPPPPPPPPEPLPAVLPPSRKLGAPAPKRPKLERVEHELAAQGAPRETPPDPEPAPLPPAEPEVSDAVLLPSGQGTGAGGVAEEGAGKPGTGSGDGAGAGRGRPPIPSDAARRARVPYTREAIEDRVGGVVLVDLLVDEHGSVAQARLKQRIGYGLDPLALATAQRFRFLPAQDARGNAIAQWITWEFRFSPAQ